MSAKELVPIMKDGSIFMGGLDQFIGHKFTISHKDGIISGTLGHYKGRYTIKVDKSYTLFGYCASIEFDSVCINLVLPNAGAIYLEPELPNLHCVHEQYNDVLLDYLRSLG